MTDNKQPSAGEEIVLTLRDAEALTGISARVLAKALRGGSLSGRNLGGRKGWVTTRNAIRKWAETGSVNDEDGGEA